MTRKAKRKVLMNLNRGQSMILAIMEPQCKLFNSKKKKMIQSLVDARVLIEYLIAVV